MILQIGKFECWTTLLCCYNNIFHCTAFDDTILPRSWDNDTNNKLQAGPKPLTSNYSSSLNDLSRNSEERVFIAKVGI